MFLITVTSEEYEKEVKPLLALLRVQHTGEDQSHYVASSGEFGELMEELDSQKKDADAEIPYLFQSVYALDSKEVALCLLVNRTLTRCFPVEPDYPFKREWFGCSPFRMLDSFEIAHLAELSRAPMVYQGRHWEEGKLPSAFEQQETFRNLCADIDERRGAHIHQLFMKDLLDERGYESISTYLGYSVEGSWEKASWARKKILSAATLEDWNVTEHLTSAEAQKKIRTLRAEKNSDTQILFLGIHDYLVDGIDYDSLKLYVKILKKTDEIDPPFEKLDSEDEETRKLYLRQYLREH
jgi:hypothetical protein